LTRTLAAPTSLFLSVTGTKLIECLIKVCQELKMPTFGYVFGRTVNFLLPLI
jgi:hypothetical protein